MTRAEGDGYAIANLNEVGEGYGFRKVRKELGVSEFGVNAIVLPPGLETGFHAHERQQELYFVHSGRIAISVGDEVHELGPGGLARVDPGTVRQLRNLSDTEEAVYLCVGGADGYVGRDGRLPDDEVSAR